ncbi:hypothetical protein LUZ60_004852 [Juncus effusus]|nr:hypothetical protein LUZ60_004852 [Juncus effusus]
MENKQEKKNLFVKTMERCKSFGSHMKKPRSDSDSDSNPSSSHKRKFSKRSKSTNCVAGCFTVCVGPSKERFIVRTECLNHPLFQALLEEAENEFGFASDGPVELPCDVEGFEEVMLEMEQALDSPTNSPRCSSFNNKSPYRYGLVSPSKLVVNGRM